MSEQMRIADFDYELPDELVAQKPLADRAASRMMVLDRSSGSLVNSHFADIGNFLYAGDTLVLNNTRVFPARLMGESETGAGVEIFLIRDLGDGLWESLGRPAKRLPRGKKILFGEGFSAEVVDNGEARLTIKFNVDRDFQQMLERFGRTPLPPYIKRQIASPDTDRDRYQTVFARNQGAIAAPTAGLHFTSEILTGLKDSGVNICEITLHVGYGTFEPVRVDDLSEHRVLPEAYEISEEAAEMLNLAQTEKRRIVAVGTTTTRALETALARNGRYSAERASAELTITPGYKFRAIGAMLTNFHLPRSSLLLLVSSFAGYDLTMKAYRHAVASRYRFFSYGDCMLIT
jgi:S-adenosylmethionine:tRNA ribosyltransferase-isomerase